MLLLYILVGLCAGAAVTFVARGIFAPAPNLADLADGTYRARMAARVGSSRSERIRSWLLQLFPESKIVPRSLTADLRLTRTLEEAHIIAKYGAAAQGFGIGIAAGFAIYVAGIPITPAIAIPLSVTLGAVAFFLPDLSVRSQAAEKRDEFISAFAAYLDLTRILMGASDGPESAMEKAAARGQGWVFAEIRRALDLARSDQTMKHWEALADLGDELDIIQLREFADAMTATATSQGLPATLGARAQAMRNKAMRSIEGDAESKTEQMDIPLTLLTMASTIFIMYAAISQVSGV